jgi:hypothetical protein
MHRKPLTMQSPGGCEPQGHKQTSPPKAFGADPPGKILSDRDLCVSLTGNAEAVQDCARRVGAVERVEMNSGYVVIVMLRRAFILDAAGLMHRKRLTIH